MQLQAFEYKNEQQQDKKIRTVEINGEIWFVAKDICDGLGLINASKAINSIDKDDLSTGEVIDQLGRNQTVNIINESGMYALIFKKRGKS